MRTIDVEIEVARFFGWRQNLIVPNISWGMGLHECDLLILKKSGYLWEVEIKISKTDLKKDSEKRHGHYSKKIKRLYFAIPEKLYNDECVSYIPERAGILVVKEIHPFNGLNHRCFLKRAPKMNKYAVPISLKEQYKMACLGAMRIWTLKKHLVSANAK